MSSEWSRKTGTVPDEVDVEKLFDEFNPLQMDILEQYSQLIACAAEMSETAERKDSR